MAHEHRTGIGGSLARLIFLRGYRCSHDCGWRGLRFSYGLFHAEKKRLRRGLIVVLFIVSVAATVYLVLSHAGPRLGGPHDDSEQAE